MLTLGLESSCDETACALVDSHSQILANVVASQGDHAAYGGVVPELASRAHLREFPRIVSTALNETGMSLQDVELIAVTQTPGLIGSLSIGVNFAKGLAIGSQKPIIGVNHVEAHLYAAFMGKENVEFPALGLVISGAHTAMFYMKDQLSYQLIGKSRDDALGETFDKVARFLGLPYPGGSLLEKLAAQGSEEAYAFSVPKVPGYEFSFSGLKTAVLYAIKGNNSNNTTPFPELSEQQKCDLAASFQKAAFASVAQKLSNVVKRFSLRSILVGGGVANNQYFQSLLKNTLNLPLYFPSAKLCSDNAAMIAGLGRELYLSKQVALGITPCARYHWQSVSDSFLQEP